jgi:hypothetical protein
MNVPLSLSIVDKPFPPDAPVVLTAAEKTKIFDSLSQIEASFKTLREFRRETLSTLAALTDDTDDTETPQLELLIQEISSLRGDVSRISNNPPPLLALNPVNSTKACKPITVDEVRLMNDEELYKHICNTARRATHYKKIDTHNDLYLMQRENLALLRAERNRRKFLHRM